MDRPWLGRLARASAAMSGLSSAKEMYEMKTFACSYVCVLPLGPPEERSQLGMAVNAANQECPLLWSLRADRSASVTGRGASRGLKNDHPTPSRPRQTMPADREVMKKSLPLIEKSRSLIEKSPPLIKKSLPGMKKSLRGNKKSRLAMEKSPRGNTNSRPRIEKCRATINGHRELFVLPRRKMRNLPVAFPGECPNAARGCPNEGKRSPKVTESPTIAGYSPKKGSPPACGE